MYSFISKIAIAGAALILVGHSLFPHNHEDDSGCLPELREDTIIHLLSYVFEQDLGIDHLENYLSIERTSIPSPSSEMLIEDSNTLIEGVITETAQKNCFYLNRYKLFEPVSSGPPRSPPVA